MEIQTWQDAKNGGLTQTALQALCDYDLALHAKIATRLAQKHSYASQKQIAAWAAGAMRKKYQREHWGWSAIGR